MIRRSRLLLAALCLVFLVSVSAASPEGSDAELTAMSLLRLVEGVGLPSELLYNWHENMVSFDACTGEGTDLSLLASLNKAVEKRFSPPPFDPAIHTTFGYIPSVTLGLDDEQRIEELQSYLTTHKLVVNTSRGDVLAGSILVNVLFSLGNLETATQVFHNFLASADPDNVDQTTRVLLPMVRVRLGSALLREARTEADLTSGMELLREASEMDREVYRNLIRCTFGLSDNLPLAKKLGGARAEAEVASSLPQQLEAAEFETCETLLGDPGAMRKAFEHYQGLILQQPDRAEELMSEGLSAIQSHAGQATEPLSLGFMVTGISSKEIFKIIAEVGDFDLDFEDSLEFGDVAIWAVNLPLGLILAEVLEVQGLATRCAGRTIRVEASPGRADPATHLPRVLLAFVLAIDPPELAQESGEGRLRWLASALTMRYQGQIAVGQPAGRGQLLWDETENRVAGNFDGVYLDGDVEIQFPGLREFTGRFHRGLAHGPGRLIEASLGTIQEGRFTHGRFTGIGQQAVREGLVYTGPIVDSQAHGQGRCAGPSLSYQCEFDHGELIALAGVPLPR